MRDQELTAKQLLFIEAYLGRAKGNATEAARLAGYSGNDNTLRQTGHKLVMNGNIAPKLKTILEEEKKVLSADELWQHVSFLVKGAKNERDQLKAADMLFKCYGEYFRDRIKADMIKLVAVQVMSTVKQLQADYPDADPQDLLQRTVDIAAENAVNEGYVN